MKQGKQVVKSDYGRWIHTAFTAASFAYFLAVIDKVDLLISNGSLAFATLSFALALVLNSLWAVVYYGFDGEIDISALLEKYWLLRRFDSLSQWSFIFAVIALLSYIVEPVLKVVL